jgi:hypothetical protein
MKCTFLILCFILCAISFALYSSTTFNWKVLHTLLKNSLINLKYPSENSTFNYTDDVFVIPSTEKISITSSNRRFAIFACSIHSKTLAYSFYTPITAASWKRVGYETIVVFVGNFTLPNVLTARLNLTRTYLKYVGANIIDIQCNSSFAIKLSQLVRVFAGFLPDSIVHDDDDILTGDSDLMPLKASEYQPTNGTDGFIFNAFCCGSFKRRGRSYRMFPS